jgi:hypothetical protein
VTEPPVQNESDRYLLYDNLQIEVCVDFTMLLHLLYRVRIIDIPFMIFCNHKVD